jgi:hypothetical protein
MQKLFATFLDKNASNNTKHWPFYVNLAALRARRTKPTFFLVAFLIITTIFFTLLITPANATALQLHASKKTQAQSIAATAYLTTDSLFPIFQQSLSQQTPGTFKSTVKGLTKQLPKQDQSWATQMAQALLQPSATITNLQPQANGLATSISISLYNGDPKPTSAQVLVTFQVINASTIQVSAQPLPGSASLLNGPLQTFTLPFGNLQSINTTPGCGDAALATHLTISTGTSQQGFIGPTTSPTVHSAAFTTSRTSSQQPIAHTSTIAARTTNAQPITTYIEIPATSLTTLGSSIGSMSVGNNLTAKNIQPTVQGSNLVVTSDIYGSLLGANIKLGVATTMIQPLASNGQLVLHVTKTSLKLFSLITFPENTYNAQIEQALKQQIGGAIPSSLYISTAAIGYNAVVPCAASNSLILTGTTSLG